MTACTGEPSNGLVSIEVHLAPEIRFQPMTMTPDIPLIIDEYRVYGSGPVSSSFEVLTGESSCVIEDLLPGEWTIGAEGFNSGGAVLFTGETATVLDQDSVDITINLTEPEGEGTLQLSFSWEAGFVADPLINAVLTSSEGTTIPLDPVITGGTAAAGATLNAGLYELTTQLYDGGEPAAGAADYIKIIAGLETAGSVNFNVVLTPVSPNILLNTSILTPLEVTIDGYDPPLFIGTPVMLSGVTEPGITPVFKWFVDGVAEATGAEYVLDTSLAGTRRIDLLAVSEGYASGGSVTLDISVHEPVYYGSLIFVESVFDNQGGADGLSDVRAAAVWGDYLYTAGYGEDEIGVYGITESTGKLAFKEVVSAGNVPEPLLFDGPSCLVADENLAGPGAAGIAAGFAGSGALFLFGIDAETGGLSYLSTIAPLAGDFTVPAGGAPDIPVDVNPLAGVSAVAASPGGGMLFASSGDGDTITSYTVSGGAITPYQIVSQGTLTAGGYDGALLDGPEDIAVSPDGSLLAVACRYSDSLLVFRINESDALLTPIAFFTDGVDGIDGLNGSSGVSFSPDGSNIYATGYYDDAVSLLTENPVDGVWTFADAWKESDFPGTALHYPRGVTVSPDGTEVYVCAGGSDALTVFSRSVDTGILSAPASAVNGDDRNVGLDGVRRVVTAGDGGYVYAASSNDDAAALFRRE